MLLQIGPHCGQHRRVHNTLITGKVTKTFQLVKVICGVQF